MIMQRLVVSVNGWVTAMVRELGIEEFKWLINSVSSVGH